MKDGEATLTSILSKLMANDRDFKDIGGLYMPGPDRGPVSTGTETCRGTSIQLLRGADRLL